MKKSTILFVALVYIISFLIVGLFGIAVKGYHEVIYVDDIKITVPEQGITINDKTDYEAENIEYYFTTKYSAGLIVQLKAEVLPAETSFPDISVVYDTEQSAYTVNVVDGFYIHVAFNKKASCTFRVQSTDGNKLQVPVEILAR